MFWRSAIRSPPVYPPLDGEVGTRLPSREDEDLRAANESPHSRTVLSTRCPCEIRNGEEEAALALLARRGRDRGAGGADRPDALRAEGGRAGLAEGPLRGRHRAIRRELHAHLRRDGKETAARVDGVGRRRHRLRRRRQTRSAVRQLLPLAWPVPR